MANQVTAANAGERVQFRFAADIHWLGMPEFGRRMHAFCAILLLLVLTGCHTSFENSVKAELSRRDNTVDRVFNGVDSIARQHGLTPDRSESNPGKRMGYFGPPYHYYFCAIKQISDESLTVDFVHEARMSSRKHRRSHPEKQFLAFVTNTFGSDIISLRYNFNE